MKRFKILVPVDFTNETDVAIQSAVNLSKEIPLEIVFIHVVSKSSEVEEKLMRLEWRISRHASLLRGPYKSIVRVGKLFDQLAEAGKDNEVDVMLLGIHEASTMNKMFGSNALRVVGNCKFPIITIKGGDVFRPIKKIVITMDVVMKSVQIVRHVEKIAQLFNAKVFLIGGQQKDDALRKKSRIYFAIAEKRLIEANIECEALALKRKGFKQHLLDFCNEEKIDLLAATFYNDNETVLSVPFVQQLMDNKLGIPTMIIDGIPSNGTSQLAGIIS
ncbi:MAG: universal stress protein [bacterium]|nr:universal stress protein [bacterium]